MAVFRKFGKNVHPNEGDGIGYLDLCYPKIWALNDFFWIFTCQKWRSSQFQEKLTNSLGTHLYWPNQPAIRMHGQQVQK